MELLVVVLVDVAKDGGLAAIIVVFAFVPFQIEDSEVECSKTTVAFCFSASGAKSFGVEVQSDRGQCWKSGSVVMAVDELS